MAVKKFDTSTVAPRLVENVTKSDTAGQFAPSLIQVCEDGAVVTFNVKGIAVNHGTKTAGDVLFGLHTGVKSTGTAGTIFIRGEIPN